MKLVNKANGLDYIDNLRLTWKEEQELVRSVEVGDSREDKSEGRERRRSRRRLYVTRSGLLVEWDSDHQQEKLFRVIPRNISEGGIAVLTGAFAYVDTKVRLTFILDGSETLQVTGVVRRCRHVRGKIHDVGIEFDTPLKSGALFDEEVDLDKLESNEGVVDSDEMKVFTGSVLYLENDPLQQRMVCYLVDRLGLEVSTVDSCRAAVLAMANSSFTLLMADVQSADGPEVSFVKALRGRGFAKPFVAVSSEGDSALEAACAEAGFTGVLVKPLTLDKLRTNLSKWLGQPLPDAGDAKK